jgi:hypothetical protein
MNNALQNRASRRDEAAIANDDNLSPEDKAIRNIVRTWAGGEHVLAGARASELIYGKGNKANDKLLERLKAEGAQGIERYVAPPSAEMTTMVDDQSGNPLATQPENRPEAVSPSNASSDAGRAEQNELDKVFQPGRSQRQNPEETAINPADSEVETTVKPKSVGADLSKPKAKK